MNHKWAKPSFKWSGIKPERHGLVLPMADRVPKQYCVQCGSMKYEVPGNNWAGPWRTFLRPYDGIARGITKIPPCEGLSASYDAPIGA